MACEEMPEDELRACLALADLMLDQEVDYVMSCWIGRELGKTGLDEAQARALFENDVFPALVGNLSDPVGVWAYFDDMELMETFVYYRKHWGWRLVQNWVTRFQWALRAGTMLREVRHAWLRLDVKAELD